MKLRYLILATIALPVLLFTLPCLGSVMYRPELSNVGDYQETEFETYGDDATLLRGTLTKPVVLDTPPRGLFLLLADSNLDRDWTSGGRGFATGRILARRLAGLGFLAVRFDQRGTGLTRQSGRNYAAPRFLVRDAILVLTHLRKAEGAAADLPLSIIAQGDGCAIALGLVNAAERSPAGLILTGCGLQGNLLDLWLGRILANMRRVGVAPEIMAEAERRVADWRDARSWDEAGDIGRIPEEGQHPDLAALDRALNQMLDERLLTFTRQAAAFDLDVERERLFASPAVRISHYIGASDQVLPAADREAARRAASEWDRRYGERYSFRELPRTDHFLGERADAQSGSLILLINNLNPLRRISPAFLNALDQEIGATRS